MYSYQVMNGLKLYHQYLRDIKFYLTSAEGQNWDSLLRVIATRDILEEVVLSAVLLSYTPRNHPELFTPFLQSIQQNPSIHTVKRESPVLRLRAFWTRQNL
jgi:hypothetical protein